MKSRLLYIFLFQLFFLHIESKACSCSFDKYLTIEEYNRSAFIFTGTVIRIDTLDQMTQKVYFLIDTLYKGNSNTDTILVHTPISSGMCGIRFKLDEQRLIFTSYRNDFVKGRYTNELILFTNSCYRNCRIVTNRAEISEIIWKYNYQFLKQIQQNQNVIFDQYYLSKKNIFYETPPDTLYTKGSIKNGIAVGTWYYYNADKILCKEITFTGEGISIKEIYYYPNGNIEYEYVFDKNGKAVIDIHYNEKGKLENYVEYDDKTGTRKPQEINEPNSTGARKKVYYKPSDYPLIIKY